MLLRRINFPSFKSEKRICSSQFVKNNELLIERLSTILSWILKIRYSNDREGDTGGRGSQREETYVWVEDDLFEGEETLVNEVDILISDVFEDRVDFLAESLIGGRH